ncbi:MAG: crossover junction endodeoxyribonuclease RuvC [Acidobacteria bacterium]|nr:MAG: crossover junction endodeoxyribonuclease RuvC [Acidobacteriota bacterium]PIE90962.1 MAG: crossover junction endodeoxyribonuclease RuvC [Acidobacteriota bacterium]
MIILGIDPGSRVTGYGVIQAEGNQIRHLKSGAFSLYKTEEMSKRLGVLYTELDALVQAYQPVALSLEKAFSGINVRSALLLGQVRGAVLAFAGMRNIPVFEYAATAVKKAVTGYGRAEKEQVQEMVRILLSLPQIPKPHDAADGLALAICHAHTNPQRW